MKDRLRENTTSQKEGLITGLPSAGHCPEEADSVDYSEVWCQPGALGPQVVRV